MTPRSTHVRCLAAIACLALAACGGRPAPVAAAAPTHEIRDARGTLVRVPVAPRRIASLCTSATDALIRLGCADRVIGIDEYSRTVPGATALPVIGRGSAVSREQIVGREIDLAFVWWYQDEVARQFEELGVPVLRLDSVRADAVPDQIRLIGRAAGCGLAADQLADRTAQSLAGLSRTGPARRPVRVYAELYGPGKTMGAETYLDDLIRLAGGTNIAGGVCGSVLFSAEHLLQADPDAILFVEEFTTAEALAARPALGGLSAVRSRRLFPIDRYTLVTGAGLPEAVARLRALIDRVRPQET